MLSAPHSTSRALRARHRTLVVAFSLTAITWGMSANGLSQKSIESARDVLASTASTKAEIADAEATLQDVLKGASDPSTQGQAALALAHSAMFLRHDLAASIPHFENARTLLSSNTPEWREATFGLATALQHRLPVSPTSIEMASKLYEEILAADQKSLVAARSLMSLGRIHEVFDYTGDQQQHEKARERYAAILEGWPEEEIAYEAAFRFGSTYIQEAYYPPESSRNDWDWRIEQTLKGIRFLDTWVKARPNGDLAPGVWEYIGNAYLLLPEEEKWREQALRAYLQATGDGDLIETGEAAPLKRNMDRVNPGYLYLRIAGLAHQQGQREVAFEYYGRLISEVPDYAYGPEAALQLTANLGYSQDEVVELLRSQYHAMGYSEVEIERLLSDFEFLEPPVGVPVPEP